MELDERYPAVGEQDGRQQQETFDAVTVYTSFNLYYADRALVLLDSVRKFHPSWSVVAVVVEPEVPSGAWGKALAAFDDVILARSMFGDDFDSWIHQHDVVEACTAVKGRALELLLGGDCDAVIYLDPDTQLLARLDAVLAQLADHSALLTPHVLAPATSQEAIWDGEIGSLKHGVFNLGFLAVRNCPEGHELAQWWADRLKMACWDYPTVGLFTDQRWMDLAPGMFPNVGILRDPGTNVAAWNLSSRKLTRVGVHSFEALGCSLSLYHFTKAEGVGRGQADRLSDSSDVVSVLWDNYLKELRAKRDALPRAPKWGYAGMEAELAESKARRVASKPTLNATTPGGSVNMHV